MTTSEPCESANNCMHFLMGHYSDCSWCMYNKDNEISSISYFRSIDGQPHASQARLKPHLGGQNKSKDKLRQAISKGASKAELGGFKRAVKKSSNSGRLRKDGDWTIGEILVDYKKHQTKSVKIDPDELYKAQMDAKRSAKKIAVINTENIDGERFIFMTEEDFYRLLN